jgi:hypothetical protein
VDHQGGLVTSYEEWRVTGTPRLKPIHRSYLTEEAAKGPSDPPAERLARADRNGSSAYNYKIDGGWEDEGFTYEQRGWLPRSLLVAACEALERDDEPAVWDLLEPFEEGMEVRRG